MAAESAAKAALLNAQALVTQIRPYMLLELSEDNKEFSIGYPIIRDPEIVIGNTLSCLFSVKNYGKTPAQDLLVRADLILGDSRDAPPNIAIADDGQRRGIPKVIPSGNVISQYALRSGEGFAADEWDAVMIKRTKFAWLRGVIEYSHAIDKPRHESRPYETRFCFWLGIGDRIKFMWMAGPDSCNEAT